MNARKRRRAIAALLMLAAIGIGAAESVAGELVDTAEHYDDSLADGATADATGAVEADERQEGQHIKGYDHCTHVHGTAVRGAALPLTTVSVVPLPSQTAFTARPPDVTPPSLYHPPKP